MATANIELSPIAYKDQNGFALRGPCIRSEALSVSGSTATLANAVSSDEADAGVEIATISTDTALYYAIGTAPDPTSLVKTKVTTARRLLQAGFSSDDKINVGEKVAVKALA